MKKLCRFLLCSLLASAFFACSGPKPVDEKPTVRVYKVTQITEGENKQMINGDKDEFYIVVDNDMEFPTARVVRYDVTTPGSEKAYSIGAWKESDSDGSYSLYTVANRIGKFVPEHKDDEGETVAAKFTFDSKDYEVADDTKKYVVEEGTFDGKDVKIYNGVFFEYTDLDATNTPYANKYSVLLNADNDTYTVVYNSATTDAEPTSILDVSCQFASDEEGNVLFLSPDNSGEVRFYESNFDKDSIDSFAVIDTKNMKLGLVKQSGGGGTDYIVYKEGVTSVAKCCNFELIENEYVSLVANITLEGASAPIEFYKEEEAKFVAAPSKISDKNWTDHYILINISKDSSGKPVDQYTFAHFERVVTFDEVTLVYKLFDAACAQVEADGDGNAVIVNLTSPETIKLTYNANNGTLTDGSETKECGEVMKGSLIYYYDSSSSKFVPSFCVNERGIVGISI